MERSDVVATIKGLSGAAGHKWVVDTYNAQRPLPRGYKLTMDDPWCAGTVSAVFLSQGESGFSECSCPQMVEKAKALGIWVESDSYTPRLGDVCLYDWQDSGKGDNVGMPDHVGIIIEVNEAAGTFTVREGNKSKSIGNRKMKIDGECIRGFIAPNFGRESKNDSNPTNTTKEEIKPDNGQKNGYVGGRTYTIRVNTALNVRKGAGVKYPLVGFNGLSNDAKKHATPSGALRNGTRVTCLEVKFVGEDVWMRIPSGWICAINRNNVYVK